VCNEICPRCNGPIPNLESWGKYPGALSRTDNKTEICSECGVDEAHKQYAGRLEPQSEWAVNND